MKTLLAASLVLLAVGFSAQAEPQVVNITRSHCQKIQPVPCSPVVAVTIPTSDPTTLGYRVGLILSSPQSTRFVTLYSDVIRNGIVPAMAWVVLPTSDIPDDVTVTDLHVTPLVEQNPRH